jgi:hypothetical protein
LAVVLVYLVLKLLGPLSVGWEWGEVVRAFIEFLVHRVERMTADRGKRTREREREGDEERARNGDRE